MRSMLPTVLTVLFVTAAVLLCRTTAVSAEEEADFYDILGLPQKDDSSERDIKTSWRKLSRENHPDLKGESSRDNYVKIQRAYEVLSDRRKRKMYDMRGEEGLKQLEAQGNQPQQQQQHGFNPFGNMFGGGQGQDPNRGSNVEMMLLVTLEDVYAGAEHSVKLTKQKLCRHCKGSGADSKTDMMKCKRCKGKGTVIQKIQLAPGFVQQAHQPCPVCSGKGTVVKKKCRQCSGQKVVKAEQTLSIDVEPGTPENHEMIFEMEADQNPDQIPGDVKFTVMTEPHKTFLRKGNDLLMTLKMPLKQALLGYSRTFKHLDGHSFDVEQDGVIQYGQTLKVVEEGMPFHNVPSEKGDLIVTFEIELPDSLDNQQREQLNTIFPN